VRSLWLVTLLLAACGRPVAPAPPLPVLEAGPLKPETPIHVDGMAADEGWRLARELRLPLTGPGPKEVRLKAAHDGHRLYLLAMWQDPDASLDRYWKYAGHLKWEKSEREDGFAVLWAPGTLAAGFRREGCALLCHDGAHRYPGEGNGIADAWYFGAQQTKFFPQARDLWLRQGANQRLRGDNQPADSDNLLNQSDRYEGPRWFPKRIVETTKRLLFADNLQEATPDWIERYWKDESNIGREVPLDVLRARLGSRGDVRHASRYLAQGRTWVLEMVRDFETGNPDDLPLGDPLVPGLFAVAVYDAAGGADHAVSGPVELRCRP